MSIRTLIDGGLQYLTNRRHTMVKTKKQTRTQVGERCRTCGGSVVEVNVQTHRRACLKCGKEAI